MTKKHYEAIATIFLHHKRCKDMDFQPSQSIEKDLADYFATDNKNFNREKFLQACGIE